MSLFSQGSFQLASGKSSSWKIQCEYLTNDDLRTLALMASRILPPFSEVHGVPTGALKFTDALESYVTKDANRILIAEDVVTTGGSMTRFKNQHFPQIPVIGVCIFSRGQPPGWVTPLFMINTDLYT